MGPTDLGAEWIVPLERPEPAAEKPLGHRHKAQHIDEHGDGDAAARALAEVDVISPAPMLKMKWSGSTQGQSQEFIFFIIRRGQPY